MRPEQEIHNEVTQRWLKRIAILGLLSVLTVSFAEAQTWTGSGDGTSWNDGSNWSNGVVPNSATAVVNFNPPDRHEQLQRSDHRRIRDVGAWRRLRHGRFHHLGSAQFRTIAFAGQRANQ